MSVRSAAGGLPFVPYGDLGGAPHVVVDGSPTSGTILCLSHWPGIGSPPELAADLSAEMAFLYVDGAGGAGGGSGAGGAGGAENAAAASNNHFDQDGLVGVYALTAPADAMARRDFLVEVARAGDFAVTSSPEAARVSMVLSAYADPARSPLRDFPSDDYDALTAVLYSELLGRLPELCDHPDRSRDLWGEEDATLLASERAITSGGVAIHEVHDLDLAVIEVPESAPDAGGHRFAGSWVSGLHPMAIHNATDCGALLNVRGRRYEFTYRYESWVQFRSRPVRPRVDLAGVAARLSECEADAGGSSVWVAEHVSSLTPTLAPAGGAESELSAHVVRDHVESHLRQSPPAWDPYEVTR